MQVLTHVLEDEAAIPYHLFLQDLKLAQIQPDKSIQRNEEGVKNQGNTWIIQ